MLVIQRTAAWLGPDQKPIRGGTGSSVAQLRSAEPDCGPIIVRRPDFFWLLASSTLLPFKNLSASSSRCSDPLEGPTTVIGGREEHSACFAIKRQAPPPSAFRNVKVGPSWSERGLSSDPPSLPSGLRWLSASEGAVARHDPSVSRASLRDNSKMDIRASRPPNVCS